MSQSAEELNQNAPEVEETEYEPEPSKEQSWFFKDMVETEKPPEEGKETSGEEKKEPETLDKPAEEAAPVPPPPSAPPVMPPNAPPPEFVNYVMPVLQQQAQTNQSLQQLATLYAQSMAPPPPEIPKPDPIDEPEKFAQYMFEQQFEPIRRQQEQMAQQQQFMLADQQRQLCETRNPKFSKIKPAVYQMAQMVPMSELAKPGTWDLLYHSAKSFIEDNMPHLLSDSEQAATGQVQQNVAPQRFPTPKEAAPHIPSGTMGGGSNGKPKMTEKFVRECRKLGQNPEEVLAFAMKEGIKPEELMD